jgi:hypothetical protein
LQLTINSVLQGPETRSEIFFVAVSTPPRRSAVLDLASILLARSSDCDPAPAPFS